jgi:hypothetical protein
VPVGGPLPTLAPTDGEVESAIDCTRIASAGAPHFRSKHLRGEPRATAKSPPEIILDSTYRPRDAQRRRNAPLNRARRLSAVATGMWQVAGGARAGLTRRSLGPARTRGRAGSSELRSRVEPGTASIVVLWICNSPRIPQRPETFCSTVTFVPLRHVDW